MKGMLPLLILGVAGYYAYTQGYLAVASLCPSGTVATADPSGFLGKSCTSGVVAMAGLGNVRSWAV